MGFDTDLIRNSPLSISSCNSQSCEICWMLLSDLIHAGNTLLDAGKGADRNQMGPELLDQARHAWKVARSRLLRYQLGFHCICPNRIGSRRRR